MGGNDYEVHKNMLCIKAQKVTNICFSHRICAMERIFYLCFHNHTTDVAVLVAFVMT